MTSEVLMQMDEALRLDYLDAMGITQYVARTPLPGARPSPVLAVAATGQPEAGPVSAAIRPAQVSQLLDDNTAARMDKRPPPAVAVPTIATPAPTTASPAFQCQLALWTADDLLVIADMPRLDNPQQALLRNILQAIGRTVPLSGVQQFSWPISQHRDRSLVAARDHFQGLLDGGLLQQHSLRQILCFGNRSSTLLAADDDNPPLQYRDWPVTTVCALHEMLAEPARKADTWRTLQLLVRAQT